MTTRFLRADAPIVHRCPHCDTQLGRWDGEPVRRGARKRRVHHCAKHELPRCECEMCGLQAFMVRDRDYFDLAVGFSVFPTGQIRVAHPAGWAEQKKARHDAHYPSLAAHRDYSLDAFKKKEQAPVERVMVLCGDCTESVRRALTVAFDQCATEREGRNRGVVSTLTRREVQDTDAPVSRGGR